MPKEGYHTITVNNGVFRMAEQKAMEEKVSVSAVIQKAVERYVAEINEETEKIERAINIMKKTGVI